MTRVKSTAAGAAAAVVVVTAAATIRFEIDFVEAIAA
jgi:hypothetical protein